MLRKFYGMQARQEIYSDYLGHIWLLEFYLENGKFIFPPLFYLSVELFSKLLIPFVSPKVFAAGVILAAFTLLKFTLIYRYLIQNTQGQFFIMALLSLGLMLFFPYYLFQFEGPYWYMGKFTPTVWHNCTSTFVWPFSFLLFWEAQKWLDDQKKSRWYLMALWALLILLSKPSFLFAFIPVFPLMAYIKQKKLNAKTILFSSVLFLGLLGLREMIYLNSLDELIYLRNEKHSVIWLPFAVYQLYAESPILEFLASFAFLLLAFGLLGKSLLQKAEVQFALLLSLVSLLVYLLLAEEGYRFPDANFYWQIPISLSILYLVIIKNTWMDFRQKQDSKPALVSYGILLLGFMGHVASGVQYLHHYIATKSYL
ncbi:hypothetical protein SAMN04488104_100730 [Algoriphagus faecimaris]|uniref:Uncharacterized protein n=1 Tax=Algoriphagus faecimaris TaxID=686796 RepID=A0A1G6PUW9_9BACT|nr:hypothetical protein [Algoriphagus faecimaris]SDC83155.1 hypothetical protein SAMN04488104_100730 [Algoriphagus faecimaris]